MAITSASVVPRPLPVERASMIVEGHPLDEVSLGGWAYGPALGTAPVVVVVGGITASPFPFGDGRSEAEGGVEPWWPALLGPGLIDLTR